jgi:2-polyprenyl-6-hydroxyphenyl methylase/3-demethylubiquinone-9 3-methyltransferase
LWPPYNAFAQVCRSGLSFVRPLSPSSLLSDEFGWNYGSARPPSYWAYGRLRALFTLNVARDLQGKKSLEIAAGDGALSACLALGDCDVTVNDLRADLITSSVQHFKNAERISVLPGNVFDLDPAHVGTFDLVIACELIEHVADAAALLLKLKSFLSPGGRILLTTPNGAYFRNKLPTLSQVQHPESLAERQFKPDADGHLYLITPEEMYQLCASTGLSILSSAIWGTPFISGECGIRHFRRVLPMRVCFLLDRFVGMLPRFIQKRMGNSLMYVLG